MDYEKLYKETIGKLRKLHNDWGSTQNRAAKEIESVFPELRESEGERIKNEIIAFVEQSIHRGGGTPIPQEQEDKWIAWLENKGEQNLSDKVEPKFKVGDWVVDKHYSKTYQVSSIDNSEHNYYIVYSCKPLFNTDNDWPCFCENMIRLWTIQDADDGDVLEFGDHGRLVVGIVSYVNKTIGKVDVNCLLENNNFKVGNYYNLDTIKPHPATEEQCDLLFQKMKEAGYEWDDKKRELKRIEPKFKVGDCVVYNRNDSSREILYVYDIRDSRYYFNDNIHLSWSVKECNEKCHLWTIQDAEDGDALAEHETIVLFKKIEDQNIRCYCTYHYLGFNPAFYVDTLQNKNPYRPATKEQRDLLFQQMKDAGYEWDDKKKELKKIEKQIEQKSADEVKPKFKVGDWIINNDKRIAVPEQILKIEEYGYVTSRGYISFDKVKTDYHLWTIQNAKDGNVLTYVTDEEDLWIMIYWSLYELYEGHVHYHALLVNDNFSDKGTCCICIDDLKPATKEQRNLLFQKMREAGYEWDDEKKELKKIKQKSTWSEEDEKKWSQVINEIEAIKSNSSTIFEKNVAQDKIDWLKSLKDRVQPQQKQEWSEEDERNSAFIVAAIDAYSRIRKENDNKNGQDDFDKAVNWIHNRLKYLHPQLSQNWKPSEEQLKTLWDAICYVEDDINSNFVGGCMLESLYNDLKKL